MTQMVTIPILYSSKTPQDDKRRERLVLNSAEMKYVNE